MNVSLLSVVNDWNRKKGIHICYLFKTKKYIETVVSFIISGIKNEELVLLVENERNMIPIKKEIQKQFTKEQLVNFHIISNFDFYWLNGDFHPQTISEYFSKVIDPLLAKGTFVRTWAHVEWGDEKEATIKIKELENGKENLDNEKDILSVSAYDRSKIPCTWGSMLIKCHNVTITDQM